MRTSMAILRRSMGRRRVVKRREKENEHYPVIIHRMSISLYTLYATAATPIHIHIDAVPSPDIFMISTSGIWRLGSVYIKKALYDWEHVFNDNCFLPHTIVIAFCLSLLWCNASVTIRIDWMHP